ncbi:MAG TPA: hypothetical protein EYO58_10355 [Flavobacteriales bacterium]|nr:hypothetical protein [Flavobacteriales bacterium]
MDTFLQTLHLYHTLHQAQYSYVSKHTPFLRINSVDIRQLTPSDTPLLQHLIAKHAVLYFSNQQLTPQDELHMNQLFDYHSAQQHTHSFGFSESTHKKQYTVPYCEQVQVMGKTNGILPFHEGLTNVRLEESLTYENEGFHSDGIHDVGDFKTAVTQDEFPILTSLYARHIRQYDGQTYFADSRKAYHWLTDDMKKKAEHLLVHYRSPINGVLLNDGICQTLPHHVSLDTYTANTVHPLVRTHHETRDKAIFLNCAHMLYTSYKNEPHKKLSFDESTHFLYALLHKVCHEPYVYAHTWNTGDFVIWDNRICLHSAPKTHTSNMKNQERIMHRVRLTGASTFNADCADTWQAFKGGLARL